MAVGLDLGSLTGSKFDSESTVKKLVEAESAKKNPLLNQQFRNDLALEAWNVLQMQLKNLDDLTKEFYSPLSDPFRDFTINSSFDGVTPTISGNIKDLKPNLTYQVEVLQIASPKSISSDLVGKTTSIPAGEFTIEYQDKKIPIAFAGGDITSLGKSIQDATSDFLEVETLEDGDQYRLKISTKKMGEKEDFIFSGNTLPLQEIGVLTLKEKEKNEIELNLKANLSAEMKETASAEETESWTRFLHQDQELEYRAEIPYQIPKSSVLHLSLDRIPTPPQWKEAKAAEQKPQLEEANPVVSTQDKLWVGDALLKGETMIQKLPDLEESKPAETPVEDVFIEVEIALKNQEPFKKRIPIQESPSTLGAISLEPIELPASAELLSIKISTNEKLGFLLKKSTLESFGEEGQFELKNSISSAQDAIVRYEGVSYHRQDNSISDIVPHVQLNLSAASEKPVKLDLKWNKDSFMEKINEWVFYYNNALRFLQFVSEPNFDPKDMGKSSEQRWSERREEYDNLTEEEKTNLSMSGELFQGIFSGDFAIQFIFQNLRSPLSKGYQILTEKTESGKETTPSTLFVSQIGIQKRVSILNTSYNDNAGIEARAGLIEIAKEIFEEKLNGQLDSIRQAFFMDTNEDKIYDDGLFVLMHNNIYPIIASTYTNEEGKTVQGLIELKKQTLTSQTDRLQKQIDDFEEALEEKEWKWREDFAKVQSAQANADRLMNQMSPLMGNGK